MGSTWTGVLDTSVPIAIRDRRRTSRWERDAAILAALPTSRDTAETAKTISASAGRRASDRTGRALTSLAVRRPDIRTIPTSPRRYYRDTRGGLS